MSHAEHYYSQKLKTTNNNVQNFEPTRLILMSLRKPFYRKHTLGCGNSNGKICLNIMLQVMFGKYNVYINYSIIQLSILITHSVQ